MGCYPTERINPKQQTIENHFVNGKLGVHVTWKNHYRHRHQKGHREIDIDKVKIPHKCYIPRSISVNTDNTDNTDSS